MRRLSAIAGGLFAAMAALVTGASVLGAAIWTPPAIFAFDCEMPCWHGVRPGETPLEEVEALIAQVLPDTAPVRDIGGYVLSYTPDETRSFERVDVAMHEGAVQALIFEQIYRLALGDLIAYIGEPPPVMWPGGEGGYPGRGVWFVVAGCCCDSRHPLRPNMAVRKLYIRLPWEQEQYRDVTHWRGWSSARYCSP